MTEYKTLRVPEWAYEEAKPIKEKHDRTWGEQLVAGEADTRDEFERLTDMLLRIEEQLHPDNDTDNKYGNKELMNRLDDLESQLPRKVAEEVRNA